ncbi:hypothetical protein BGW41_006040 [Actinomortierella wolfii]|nr:hypothetical protein BGW41_006040 [Actinomortierella wolfii]
MQRSNSNYHPGSGRSSIDSSSAGSGAIAGPSHYIPPASNLTVSNHDRLLGVIEAEFKDTDRILERRDLKAFGANSERIFQELDKIRKKQLALAAKHISIETIADNDLLQTPDGRLLDADNNEIDPRVFARKGLELQELMTSLEDLGRAMSAFHDLSNSANKESSA